MRLAILIPCNFPSFQKSFVFSLLNVVNHFYGFNQTVGNKHSLQIFVENAGWIDVMREHLAETALANNVDVLVWFDSDMVFPPETLQRMILTFEQNEKIEAITGLYTWKKPPYMPHVYHRFNKRTRRFDMAAGFPLEKPFPVEGAGFGCVAIKRKIFELMERPWFKMDWGEYGEDLYFFAKAQPIRMICDPLLSCSQIREQGISVNDFLLHNKLKLDKHKNIVATEKQIKQMCEEHLGKNRGGKEKHRERKGIPGDK